MRSVIFSFKQIFDIFEKYWGFLVFMTEGLINLLNTVRTMCRRSWTATEQQDGMVSQCNLYLTMQVTVVVNVWLKSAESTRAAHLSKPNRVKNTNYYCVLDMTQDYCRHGPNDFPRNLVCENTTQCLYKVCQQTGSRCIVCNNLSNAWITFHKAVQQN